MSTTLEPLYVLDTHALIWYLKADPKLSPLALSICQAAEQKQTTLVVSVISLAEMYYVHQKKPLFADFSLLYRQLKVRPYLVFEPLLADHVLDLQKDAAIPEMHDRIIGGLARRLNAPLLSNDLQIQAAQVVQVIW